ncbi:phosphoenolpyruvate--protein phosphotransferase [Woodsholea maritima]|uniref:phosphoenolpyruvate--protein phosphotransferase n=1 Tax=Woodsholea maritima TaxID=240237 RepID=UPI0003788E2A|nr:phosphoenolpyruvate--protein phosphotransferase [Woodsholea maritima]
MTANAIHTPQRGPRRLLRRIRDLMAVQENAQTRLDRLTHIIAEETQTQVCSIYLMLANGALELSATYGLQADAVHKTRLKADEGLVGLVARRARPVSVEDAPAHPNFSYKPETGEEPFKSFVGVPILRGGRLVGVLTVQTQAKRRMNEVEIETLQTVAMLLAEVVVSGDLVTAEGFKGLDVRPTRPERLVGAALAPGMGIGVAVLHEPHVISGRMVAENAEAEEERLESAIARLRRSVDALLDSGRLPAGTPSREVLEAYRMFAHDRGWLNRLHEAVRSGLTAEAAVERVRNEHRARLMKARDANFRERLHDLEDLANRLLRHLELEHDGASGLELPENAILIARSVGPAELLDYDRTKLIGIALEEGSPTGHAAIVAKALGIPMVGQVEGALDLLEDGDRVILDGETGVLHVRPLPEVTKAYEERMESLRARWRSYANDRHEPAVTRDGVRLELHMNAGLLVELGQMDDTGADGVGLFRTEFQFMVSDTLPKLDTQIELYRAAYDQVKDKPIIFRTLDLGGDKVTSYTPSLREANPALGWRGLRMGLDRPGLYRYQLRALVRAAAGRPLSVLFPMVATREEMAQARAFLRQEVDHAVRHGYQPPSLVRAGMMVETMAAAYDLEAYFDLADFFAVGANDLMQYFYAADRQNPKVATRYEVIAPAALRLLKSISDACKRHNKPVSVCGEIAGRPLEACVLAALGYERLSMAPSSIGPVKQALRSLDAGQLGTWLASAMSQPAGGHMPHLRAALLNAGSDAGLNTESVEKVFRL